VRTEALPAAVLELHERLSAVVGEGDLDLGARPVLLTARIPREHEPVRRLVGDDVGPLQVLAVLGALEDLAARPALEDHRLRG
jgi:hypothetical protein